MLPEIKKILYTTNLGDNTRPVLRYAASLAKTHNAKLLLLHVVEPLSESGRLLVETYMSEEMAQQAEALADSLRKATSQQVLDKIKHRLEQFCAEDLNIPPEQVASLVDVQVMTGSPAEVIVRESEAQNADLIVIGTHAGSAWKAALLGSTARRVTLMSKKPVLVVPLAEDASWGD